MEYCNAPVPPPALITMEPLLDPLHETLVGVAEVIVTAAGAVTARIAQMLANFPVKVPVAAINRQCSSGLEACAIIASKIKSGLIEVGIGCGVESMTLYSMNDYAPYFKIAVFAYFYWCQFCGFGYQP